MPTHRPFEDWILDDSPLSPEASKALDRHLAGCDDCRSLSAGWEQAKLHLVRSSLVRPRPGFGQRWLIRSLAQGPGRRKGTWAILIASLAASLGAAGLTAWGLVSLMSSPAGVLQALIRPLVAWSMWFRVGGDIVQAASRILSTDLLAGMWLAFVVAWAGLIVIWLASMRRIVLQGVYR